jgi:hypothetical protein
MSSSVNVRAPDRTTRHLHHEWSEEGWASDRIVEAVAEAEDEEPDNLPDLSNSINPAALDTAFAEADDDASMAGCITFSYYGYTVLVQSTGQILIKKS